MATKKPRKSTKRAKGQARPADRDACGREDVGLQEVAVLDELRGKMERAFASTTQEPEVPEHPSESFADALEYARESHPEEPQRLDEAAISHFSRLTQVDYASRLGVALDYGVGTWDTVTQEMAGRVYAETLEIVSGIATALAASDEIESELGEAELAEQRAIAQAWMQLCGDMTLMQMTAARLTAYGRPDDEICKVLGIQLHVLGHWRNHVPAFQKLAAYWESDWLAGVDGMRKRYIADFGAHGDPRMKFQAVKMADQREGLTQQARRLELGREGLALNKERLAHEKERDERLLGMRSGPAIDFLAIRATGQALFSHDEATSHPLLEAAEAAETGDVIDAEYEAVDEDEDEDEPEEPDELDGTE